MASVVFILGAGASKDCGAPLMADFLEASKHIYETNSCGPNRRPHYEAVFRAIEGLFAVHSKAQYDLYNLESVFTAFDTANLLGRLPNFKPEEISGVYESLKEVIVDTLEQRVLFPVRRRRVEPPAPYDAFIKLLSHIQQDAFPSKSVSVLTFNYDIALDVGLACEGHRVAYGLPSDEAADQAGLPLLKLHGSLNWGAAEDDRQIFAVPLLQLLSHQHFHWEETKTVYVPAGTQLKKWISDFRKVAVLPSPVIVPPVWSKGTHHATLGSVWKRAAKELSEAEYIFVIGYSMPETDGFFRTLYALGSVGPVQIKRFAVFNPDPAIDVRFRGLLGSGALTKYTFSERTFAQAIPEIMGMFPKRK